MTLGLHRALKARWRVCYGRINLCTAFPSELNCVQLKREVGGEGRQEARARAVQRVPPRRSNSHPRREGGKRTPSCEIDTRTRIRIHVTIASTARARSDACRRSAAPRRAISILTPINKTLSLFSRSSRCSPLPREEFHCADSRRCTLALAPVKGGS